MSSPTRSKKNRPAFDSNDSRRAFVRVDFDKGAKLGIALPGGERAYDALDLSVYGVSFLAPPDDAERFVEGMELPALAFVIDGKQISAKGKVVYVRRGLAAGLAKVAVELTAVTSDDVWHLSRHVTEKAGLGKPLQLENGAIRLASKKRKPKAQAKAKTKAKAKKPAKRAAKPKRAGAKKKRKTR